MNLDHCPTCGQPWERSGPCDSIKPGSEADVLPIRCTLDLAGHPASHHERPPLWPGTPAIMWPVDE